MTDPQLLSSHTQTDELLAQVAEQMAQHTFDPTDRQLLENLVESLGDTRGMTRLRVAETLGEIGKPATPVLLKALIGHANPVVRRAAAKTITLIADPVAIPDLIYALINDEDTVVKGSSVGALARIGEASVPPLLEILASPDRPESTKGHAAWALAFIGAEAAPQIYAALESDSVDVRCAAVGAIGRIAEEKSEERAYNCLLEALTDPEAVIRTEAAALLGNMAHAPALPNLIQALQDGDGDVRKSAAIALGKIGDRSALDPLKVMLNDELTAVQVVAKLAISQLTAD
jgi:bilin biosynthesis protein